MRISHILPLVLLAAASIPAARGEADVRDPLFAAVPFDRWLTEGDQGHFHWTVRLGGTELNFHQRLQTRVEVEVDGAELVNRRGHGKLGILLQLQDSAGHVYQTHALLDLQDVQDGAEKSNIQYFQDAMVLPGDYRLSVALVDAKTGEHSVVQKPIRVNALRNDPLPAAWQNLPAVELWQKAEGPDSWFLPDLKGRLHLPVSTRRPVQLEVLMNASTTGPSRGLSAGTATTRSLANQVPALKVLSELQMDGAAHFTVLDVSKRKAIFEQNAGQLDWTGLRDALTVADPNKIDVHALERSGEQAQYFLDQVRKKLAPAGTAESGSPGRVLIVITAPTTFDSRQEWHPIEASEKPVGKIYYVRFHSQAPRLPLSTAFDPTPRMGRRNGNPAAAPLQGPPEAFDSLAPLLKPLQPRTFEVYTPDEFRKALANIMDEIARL